MKRLTRFLQLLPLFLMVISFSACELVMPKPEKPTIHALYIALDYKNTDQLSDLNGTLIDARRMAAAINKRGETQGVRVYTTMMIQEGSAANIPEGSSPAYKLYPTRSEIIARITEIGTQMKENDIFLFYYSGHGALEVDNSGLGGLVAAKTSADAPNGYEFLTINDLQGTVSILPGRKLIIIDACNSGQFISEYPREKEDREIPMIMERYDPNTFYLIAVTAEQLSWETAAGGIFTNHVLDALGWVRTGTTTIAIENYGTKLIEDSYILQVTGNIPTHSIAPSQDGSAIKVNDIYSLIPKERISSGGILNYQDAQTGKGPKDMVLFDKNW